MFFMFFLLFWREKEENMQKNARDQILTRSLGACCVFRPANACLRMHSHSRKWQKTFKKDEKVPFARGTREVYEEKQRKKFVGQRLGVTLKSWLTPKSWSLIWNFVVIVLFSTWTTHVNYVRFSSFFFVSLTWQNAENFTKKAPQFKSQWLCKKLACHLSILLSKWIKTLGKSQMNWFPIKRRRIFVTCLRCLKV